MRTHNLSLAFIVSLVLIAPLVLLAGCPGPAKCTTCGSDSGSSGFVASGVTPSIQVCEPDCERPIDIRLVKITLQPNESNSLDRALPSAKGLSASTHLHASVVNGSLVFNSDSDPTHKAATNTITIPAHGSEPAMHLKVDATPEAAALLRKRTG